MRLVLLILLLPVSAFSQEALVTSATAYGDSITRGVGDFSGPESFVEFADKPADGQEAGYPLRVEGYLQIPVANRGNPGEELTNGGVERFVSVLNNTSDDTVIISGGSNDAIFRVSSGRIFRALQTMINFSRARGKNVLLANVTPICCDREDREEIIEGYNDQYQAVAALNNVQLADVFKGFVNTCGGVIDECFLLSRPEGLHPNTEGYDIMAEVITANLLGIDIFSPEGQLQFTDAVGFVPKTVPDQTAPEQEE